MSAKKDAPVEWRSIDWKDCQGRYAKPNTATGGVGHKVCTKPFGTSCIHELYLGIVPRGILHFCRMCPQTEGIQKLPPQSQRANIGMSK